MSKINYKKKKKNLTNRKSYFYNTKFPDVFIMLLTLVWNKKS